MRVELYGTGEQIHTEPLSFTANIASSDEGKNGISKLLDAYSPNEEFIVTRRKMGIEIQERHNLNSLRNLCVEFIGNAEVKSFQVYDSAKRLILSITGGTTTYGAQIAQQRANMYASRVLGMP